MTRTTQDRFISRAARFLRAEAGNISMLTALLIIPLAGVTGAAIDYSVALNVRGKLQQISDVASLAATKAISKDPTISDAKLSALVKTIFKASGGNLNFAKKVTSKMIRQGNGVRVEAKSKVSTNVIRVLGIKKIDVAVFSESAPSVYKKVELALVLDNTGSMGSDGKMQALKDSANLLIDTLIPSGSTEENVKISIVPYDVTVNIGTGFASESWLKDTSSSGYKGKYKHWNPWGGGSSNWGGGGGTWCGLVKPANTDYVPVVSPDTIETYNEPCAPLPDIQPLTGLVGTLKAKINAMQPSGWTYIPAGLMWGWRTLDPGNPYTQGKPYDDEEWQKIIVLMTDGVNTSKWSNGKLFTNIASGAGDAKTKVMCKDIKKKDIRVFTIAFGVNSSSTERLLKKCATQETDYFATNNASELRAAFSAIAGNINRMRLTR